MQRFGLLFDVSQANVRVGRDTTESAELRSDA